MMNRLGWIIALSCLLKVTASLLRRGQRSRGEEGATPEAEGVAENAMSNNNAPHSKYDVFVSFRGEDIRKKFLSHLVKDFSQKQIYTFTDQILKTGDEIEPSLFEAIKGSYISLIIFSENYASSHWCLDELVKIMECKEKYGQIVIPIFYGVEPTDVRHQRKSYEKAFVELKKRYSLSKVQSWRHALETCATLSGFTSSSRNDAELVEKISTRVLESLSKHPVSSKGLIGINKPIARLKSLLQKESKKVRVIGIWGMGGIGKTTIAEKIFSQNRSKYDGCCLLEKVSEKLKKRGMEFIKEKLFSTLLNESVKELSSGIERRIGRMKVLIVLDDVNKTDLLEKLFGSLDWLRSDSRIIVTSRDKQVLIDNEVDNDDLCEVGKLDSCDALALFNSNAFKRSHLKMEYHELSKRVIGYADGIPLVLKVLALMLRGKNKEFWESKLDELKKLPIKEVYDTMRLSYDILDRLEKKYFLDIACFFNGLSLKKDYMKHLLKDCDSDISVAAVLERLKDKALITISEDNVVSMHDILQEMGREVDRQESSEDPGKRSRLWDRDDICDVLKNDKGSEAIRSIRVPLFGFSNLKLSPHVFDKMTNLQFLDFCGNLVDYDIFPQGLESFPTDLRYLHWMYPLKSFPKKFSAENLVILEIFDSRLEKLWCGVQDLVNLKEAKLSNLLSLKELPDFSKATNLNVLYISGCHELRKVHPSIFSLDKLVNLHISFCYSLTTFTGNSNLSSLKYLTLTWCDKLSEFSVTLENIVELDLSSCPINALPSSFGCQSKLETLVLSFTEIVSIPSSIKNLTRLRKLDIRFCSKLLVLPELPVSVEILDLSGTEIESIPSSIKNLTRLRKLDIRDCSKVLVLPDLPSSIETLLVECESLMTVWFPSTVAEKLMENKKRIEFWNCLHLDEWSLMNIGLNLQFNLMKFACQHLSTPEHDDYVDCTDNFDSYQALYVYRGSSVPDWFEYKTTQDDMIIDLSPFFLSPLLGFVFCFFLAEDDKLCRQVVFNITTIDVEGDGEKDGFNIYMDLEHLSNTQSDHVCMIYNQPCSQYLTRIAKNQARFKVKVSALQKVIGIKEEQEVELKGFGISPINHSTYRNLIQQMEIKEAEKKEEETKQSVTKVGR